jgi:hypothetical protein
MHKSFSSIQNVYIRIFEQIISSWQISNLTKYNNVYVLLKRSLLM